MCNISEYIYEISAVKLIAGFPSTTVAILATFFTRFRCTLWVVFKVPAAMFCHNIILMMMLRFKYDMSSHIM
ncbi:hypothetical protein SEETMRM10961_7750 [Salmonella enterica subsp. enterica serovar Typhimurium]|nr:hypothetical protein SEETMRM10961_7750 [Salmonella enterica subsp. enterica serovar Typhimurium]